MKKTILLSSILAAGALFADGVTTNTVASTEVGVMGISISTNANLIAVPFLGYTNDTITVADMVNTAQLDQDSKLYVPNADGTTYDIWTLGSNKKWVADPSVSISANGGSGTSTSDIAANVQTDRGGAFWLDPANESTVTIYLLGKPASGAGTSTAVGGKWNLIGNASGEAVSLKDLTGANFDQIAVQVDGGVLRYYTYKSGKGWRYQDSSGGWVSNDNVTIPFGRGLWYKPDSATTINWSDGTGTTAAQ